MSPTEPRPATDVDRTTAELSTRLSLALFDEVLVPLAEARRSSGAVPYFPMWREGDGTSFFLPSRVSTMAPGDFEFPGGGTGKGLIHALAAHWREEGEPALAAATSRLEAIAAALHDEAVEDDGSVDIFCYTLF
jgi:hypothetical protein